MDGGGGGGGGGRGGGDMEAAYVNSIRLKYSLTFW